MALLREEVSKDDDFVSVDAVEAQDESVDADE